MNSGHLDIATSDHCYPLERQSPVDDPRGRRQIWGESDIDEIVEQLDAVYLDRARAKEIGLKGVSRMQEMTWAKQIAALIQSLQD